MSYKDQVQALKDASERLSADAGHRIKEIPLGPTKIYELIDEGELQAVKVGRATIITNWLQYLASRPALSVKTAA